MEEKFSVSLELMIQKFKDKAKQVQDVSKNVASKIKENMSVDVGGGAFKGMTAESELLLNKINDIKATLQMTSDNPKLLPKQDILEMRIELEKLENQYEKINSKSNMFSNSFNKIHDGMNKSLKSAKRFALSLFGIQSGIRVVSRAMSAYSTIDQESANKTQAAWIGLGSMFAWLKDMIADFAIKAVSYINVFVKALTGVDFLAKAMSKSMNKASKSAGKLSKTLAGFDELNNLDDSTSGAEVDTSWIDSFKNVELDEGVVAWLEKVGVFLSPVVDGFKLLWGVLDPIAQLTWESLQELWERTEPFRTKIGEGLKWFYDEVIIPLVEWASETVIPVVLDLISQSIEFLGTIIDIANPSLQWFWDTFLVPLGKFAWDILQKAVEGLTEAFKKLTDWAKENETIVQLMANTMLSFFAGLIVYTTVKNLALLLTTLGTAFKALAGGITLAGTASFIAYAGLALLAGSILLIAQNWDKMNGLEKVISVLGTLAIAASVAAAAVGALQSAWTLGIAAVAIAAGVGAIAYSISQAQKRAKENIPKLSVGTPYVERSGYAMIHEGEAVVPKKFNSEEYFSRLGGSNNEQTNKLLEELIDRVERIEINPYTTILDVGNANQKYVNTQNRIIGEELI